MAALEIADPNSLNNKLKGIVSAASSKIPVVGGAIKVLLEAIWPTKKLSIWESLKDQFSHLVDERILQKELEERKSELDGLKSSMESYLNAKPSEQAVWLGAMLTTSNIIFEKLTKSSNKIHLIPLIVVHAHLHLILLRERVLFGQEIFKEDNHEEWEKELISTYSKYNKFFQTSTLFYDWKKWREEQITYKTWVERDWYTAFVTASTLGELNDQLNNAIHAKFKVDYVDVDTYYNQGLQAIRTNLVNQSSAEMVKIVEPIFYLNKIIPGREMEPPVVNLHFGELWIGPQSMFIYDRSKEGYHISSGRLGLVKTEANEDLPGRIKQVYVYVNDTVFGLKFIFDDNGIKREGSLLGTKENCRSHLINVPENSYITGVTTDISEGVLSSIQFHYSNNESSDILGNSSKTKYKNIATINNDNYMLVNTQVGSLWKYKSGIEAIQFQFAHIDYDLKDESDPNLVIHE
ncbi:insecticidal delta-endotoxin Cry8Ea1 family protein [Lysinibacillus sp. 3P01SB]|uniref:insecticidal delta-endotoxin Cry8Ea1 family protein n=1 Tax=Lysinibacillus sp. 3P01SB TaxID=3132284 RepID=UPI0039A7445D